MSRVSLYIFLTGLNIIWSCYGRLQMQKPVTAVANPVPDYRLEPKQLWQTKVAAPVRQVLNLNTGQLLVATYRGDLFLFDIKTGKRQSRYWIPYRRPVQILLWDVLQQQLFVAGIREIKVWGYDLTAGRVIDSWRLPDLDGSMIARDGAFYVVQGGRRLLKLDRKTFKLQAQRDLPNRCAAGVYLKNDGKPALLTEDGVWRWYTPELAEAGHLNLGLGPAPVCNFHDDTLVAADSHGRVVVLADTQLVYTLDGAKPVYSNPVVKGKMLYLGLADGEVRAIDLATGQLSWQWPGAGLLNLPLEMLGDLLLVPFARGQICALEGNSGQLRYALDCQEPLKLMVTDSSHVVAFRRDKRVIGWAW